MNTRDITKFQYERGQQIKATDVNARLLEVYNRFNGMGPTDTLPLTTGQFRVFDPSLGFQIVADYLPVNTTWKSQAAPPIVTNDYTFRCQASAINFYYIITVAQAGASYSFLTPGTRYTIFYNFSISGVDAGETAKVGLFNADYSATNPIVTKTGAISTDFTFSGSATFFAKTGYLTIGAAKTTVAGPPGLFDIIMNPVAQFDSTTRALYIFSWDTNRWVIPNYCGYQHPPSRSTVSGARREQHTLLTQAIKKEIDAANEVLDYL